MNVDRFLQSRQPRWAELQSLCDAARRKPERLGPDGVRRLAVLYREVAADLALARARFPGDPLVGGLASLVVRARGLVYDAEVRRRSLVAFLTTDYWRRIAERPRLVLLSAVLTFVPAVLGGLWAYHDPGAASGLVPSAFRAVTEPKAHGAHLGLPAGVSASLSASIFTNNIRVAFLAFAGGLTAGVLTGYLLITNGVLLGVVAGLAAGSGNGKVAAQLLIAHGVLEMSCIVVAGAAGLRVGAALLEPGWRPRRVVLVEAAGQAVELALGTALWLVLAGLVEGFVTPAGLGLGAVCTIGFGLGGLYWTLATWRGRVTPDRVAGDDSAATARPVIPAPVPSARGRR